MSSAQGRFTTPDPLLNSGRPWEPQSWNRYSYTLNNPLRYSDPTGLYEWDATLGGGCADKALKSGGCDGFTKQQGKDIASERKDIRNQLNKLDKSKNALLHGAATAIGKENVDNGVTARRCRRLWSTSENVRALKFTTSTGLGNQFQSQ
jgi:hypothetical protein